MAASNRRAMWLAVALGAVIVVAIAMQSMNAPAAPQRAPRPRAGQTPAPADTEADNELVDVKLERLQRERGEPAGEGRNPFEFEQKPIPAPVALPPPITKPANQMASGPIMPPRPAGPPPLPPIPLKFLGTVTKLDKGQQIQIAVLSDGRGPIYGVEGQTVAGQYMIIKIGVESIEMAYADGRGRQTIPMSGEK